MFSEPVLDLGQFSSKISLDLDTDRFMPDSKPLRKSSLNYIKDRTQLMLEQSRLEQIQRKNKSVVKQHIKINKPIHNEELSESAIYHYKLLQKLRNANHIVDLDNAMVNIKKESKDEIQGQKLIKIKKSVGDAIDT